MKHSKNRWTAVIPVLVVISLCSLLTLADDVVVVPHTATTVLDVELESDTGESIGAQITRTQSVEQIPFFVEYEIVSGLPTDLVEWTFVPPNASGEVSSTERSVRFVSTSNADVHTGTLSVTRDGVTYGWSEELDFPLHNQTEILLDASQFGNGEIASATWSASNGDPTDEVTFPIEDRTSASATLVSAWPNALDLTCIMHLADGTDETASVRALLYFRDGPPFEKRGIAGSFFETWTNRELASLLEDLYETMNYVGANTFVTAINSFYGYPDDAGNFTIEALSRPDLRGHTASPTQLDALIAGAFSVGLSVDVSFCVMPYWNDPAIGREYQSTGGGPHKGFMMTDEFLYGDGEGLEALFLEYIPLLARHPNISTVFLGAEVSDVDNLGGPVGQAFYRSIITAYRAQGYNGVLTYGPCFQFYDNSWCRNNLMNRSSTGIPFDELDCFGGTLYVPLAFREGEQPTAPAMLDRARAWIRDQLLPLYETYNKPIYIADMYCFAQDGCSFATVWGDITGPADRPEQRSWISAWLRALSEANHLAEDSWIEGLSVCAYRLLPEGYYGRLEEHAMQAYLNPQYGRDDLRELLRCYFRDSPLVQ